MTEAGYSWEPVPQVGVWLLQSPNGRECRFALVHYPTGYVARCMTGDTVSDHPIHASNDEQAKSRALFYYLTTIKAKRESADGRATDQVR